MLRIKGLTKTFYQTKSETTVVRNLTFNVKKGQVFGFLGLNGAGKTTTIKMIVGLLFADSGNIQIAGKDSTNTSSRQLLGFMSESPQFYHHLKVSEVLSYVGQLFELDQKTIDSRTDELLKRVDLFGSKDQKARQLSKGMNQRLGFAAALMNDPDLLILDEPLDGLDPVGRLDFKRLITELKKQGKTVFFSSHILSDVEEICDEVAIIDHGKIVKQGSPKDIIGKSKKSLEEIFVETVREKNAK